MTKQKKMIKFTLNEISAVDNPAQGEARAVIMKRAQDIPDNNVDTITVNSCQEKFTGNNADDAANGGEIAKDEGANNVSDATEKTAELEKRLEALEAEKQELSVLAKMSDKEKSAMTAMSDDEKKKYMDKSADERLAEIEKAAEADAVIYKALDGTEFRKSEKAAADFAKRADDLQKRLDDQIAKAEQSDLEKRADEICKNLTGELSTRAKLLKAAEAIGEDAVAILKAADAATAEKFVERGVSQGRITKGNAYDEFKQKIVDIAKARNIEEDEAETVAKREHADLYNKAVSEG